MLHVKLVISTLKIKNIEVDISDIETVTNWKYRSKIILIMQLIITREINYFLNAVQKRVQNLVNLINDRMKLLFANGVKQKVAEKGSTMTRNRGQENAWQSAHRPLEHVNPELHLVKRICRHLDDVLASLDAMEQAGEENRLCSLLGPWRGTYHVWYGTYK